MGIGCWQSACEAGGRCLLPAAVPTPPGQWDPGWQAELFCRLHNLPCERSWPLPVSTVSFQLGPLPPPPPGPLPAGGFSNPFTSGEALWVCAPNPKMASLTLTPLVTLCKEGRAHYVCSHLGAIFSFYSPSGRNVFAFISGLPFIRPVVIRWSKGVLDSPCLFKGKGLQR